MHIFKVYRSGAFCFVYTFLPVVFIYTGPACMPNLSYLYVRRNGMTEFRSREYGGTARLVMGSLSIQLEENV